jgi:hypothetical protein
VSLTGIVAVSGGIMLFIMIGIYRTLFNDRGAKNKKDLKKTKDYIHAKLSISAQKQHNEQMKAISDKLNILPFGRLTEEKRLDINQKLAATASVDDEIKIAEEIHVQQWAFVGLWVIFSAFLGLILSAKCFAALALAPLMFNLPIIMLKASMTSEEEVLENEFRNFYNLYYVQFRRSGYSIRLVDVVQSYKGIAPPEMMMFISKLEVDAQTSEIEALKLLDKRYIKNPDIHRFYSIATLVSRGDGNAEKLVETFQEELTQKKINKQLAELKRREAQVEAVIAAMLYAICTVMMVVTFVSFAS